MAAYPVVFGLVRPERFDRMHVLLRFAVFAVLAMFGICVGHVGSMVYFLLPVVVAVLVSRRGAFGYMAEDAPRVARALQWILGAFAYLALLTDRLPTAETDGPIRFEVHPESTPTVAGALLRLVTSIPLAIVLGVLGIIASIVMGIASLFVLFTERQPAQLFDFQCAVMRLSARFFAYHASFVDRYPPLTLEPGPSTPAPVMTR